MVKNLNYLLQSIIIYLLFFVGKIIGLYSSRKLFSFIFLLIAPKFKSSDIVKKNLEIFLTIFLKRRKKLFLICGKIME